MRSLVVPSGPERKRVGTGVVLAFVFVLSATPALAAAPSTSCEQRLHSSPGTPTPVLAWSLDRVFRPIGRVINSRQRMVQLGMVGMCIGLFILMRK